MQHKGKLANCTLLPHAKRNGQTALVCVSLCHGQWECQTLVNQSFVMMHLSGEVMDIDIGIIISLENYQSLSGFCRF